MPKQKTKVKGCRKAGRNKRPKGPISSFVRGTVSFDTYAKQVGIRKLRVKP